MPDMRSTVKLNGIPLKGWIGSGNSLNVYSSACTTSLSLTSTATDITGTSMSVVVPAANSTIVAVANMSVTLTASGTTMTGFFNWNGTNQGGDVVLVNTASTVTNSVTVGQSWVITGIASGTYTAKLQASASSGTVNKYTTGAPGTGTGGTTLTVYVISGSLFLSSRRLNAYY